MSEHAGATYDDLITRCLECIDAQRGRKKPLVALATTAGKMPKGFPRGELACVNSEGHSVRHYPALRVLAWALEAKP